MTHPRGCTTSPFPSTGPGGPGRRQPRTGRTKRGRGPDADSRRPPHPSPPPPVRNRPNGSLIELRDAGWPAMLGHSPGSPSRMTTCDQSAATAPGPCKDAAEARPIRPDGVSASTLWKSISRQAARHGQPLRSTHKIALTTPRRGCSRAAPLPPPVSSVREPRRDDHLSAMTSRNLSKDPHRRSHYRQTLSLFRAYFD